MKAFEHSVGLGQDLMIPEANDLESLGLQPGVAVVAAALMLAAIQFDH